MKNKSINLLVLAAVIAAVSGCEQATQYLDRESAALKQNIAAKEALYAPLIGTYEGTLTRQYDGKSRTVSFVLISTILTTQNPGRNDVSEIPSLGGNLNVLYTTETGVEAIPIAQFTSATYDDVTRRLHMSGAINTNSSLGTVLNTFDGEVVGDRIVGHVINTSRGELGVLEVERVR